MMPTTRITGQGSTVGTIDVTGSNVPQTNESDVPPSTSPSPWLHDTAPTLTDSALRFREQRLAYFRSHYDLMTGVRIAATLGGFFLLVLLTLLYKSKCKKSSHIPTPVLSMDRLSQALIHPLVEEVCVVSPGPDPILTTRTGTWDRPELRLTTPIEPRSSSESDFGSPPVTTSTRLNLDVPRRDRGHASPVPQLIDIHIIQATPSISPSHSDFVQGGGGVKVQPNSPGDPDPDLAETLSPLLLVLHAENFKYVDDSSSENLPTEEIESPSLGSDSVFTFGPDRDRRPSSISEYTGLEEDDENCALCLNLTTASIHPRDSFSEVESDYLEGRQRRSSSTQTTISDIRRSSSVRGGDTYLNVHRLSPAGIGVGPVHMASPTESLCREGKGLKQAFRTTHGPEVNSITVNK